MSTLSKALTPAPWFAAFASQPVRSSSTLVLVKGIDKQIIPDSGLRNTLVLDGYVLDHITTSSGGLTAQTKARPRVSLGKLEVAQ